MSGALVEDVDLFTGFDVEALDNVVGVYGLVLWGIEMAIF